MKKMFKVIATIAAILSMANFVACKSDDDDGDDTVAVTSVSLDKTTVNVKVGESATLIATVTPDNATDKTVSWTSSDTSVATVKDGTVTGVKAGSAIITATAGEESASAAVTVTAADSTDTSGGDSTDSGSTGSGETDTSGGDSSGSTETETTTSKTSTIAYDGSAEENVPAESGDTGVFASVQPDLAGAGVVDGYNLDNGYPKYGSQTYTGDDNNKNTSSGILIVSSLQDGTTKVNFEADTVMAYATYKFTLSAKSEVEASVKAFNTQSSALAGKIEILDSSETVKVTKTGSGSKSANDVTADSTELDAGEYTLKFSWVMTKTATLKKVNCGISGFSIKATTK